MGSPAGPWTNRSFEMLSNIYSRAVYIAVKKRQFAMYMTVFLSEKKLHGGKKWQFRGGGGGGGGARLVTTTAFQRGEYLSGGGGGGGQMPP